MRRRIQRKWTCSCSIIEGYWFLLSAHKYLILWLSFSSKFVGFASSSKLLSDPPLTCGWIFLPQRLSCGLEIWCCRFWRRETIWCHQLSIFHTTIISLHSFLCFVLSGLPRCFPPHGEILKAVTKRWPTKMLQPPSHELILPGAAALVRWFFASVPRSSLRSPLQLLLPPARGSPRHFSLLLPDFLKRRYMKPIP